MKIAVYGTLRSGGGLCRGIVQEFGSDYKYLGTRRVSGYAMYSLGSFPAVTRRKGSTIVVDIREVSLDCLRRLDQIEGVETPIGKADNDMYHDWYHREYVEVDGESVMLYAMYFEQVQDSDLIQNGDWINFINGRVDRRYTLD